MLHFCRDFPFSRVLTNEETSWLGEEADSSARMFPLGNRAEVSYSSSSEEKQDHCIYPVGRLHPTTPQLQVAWLPDSQDTCLPGLSCPIAALTSRVELSYCDSSFQSCPISALFPKTELSSCGSSFQRCPTVALSSKAELSYCSSSFQSCSIAVLFSRTELSYCGSSLQSCPMGALPLQTCSIVVLSIFWIPDKLGYLCNSTANIKHSLTPFYPLQWSPCSQFTQDISSFSTSHVY